jgi:hypothetical protein
MQTKLLYKNGKSCIAIRNGKLYVISTEYKDFSPRAFTIMNGFQVELGRNINDFIEALKETRLPVLLKQVTQVGNNAYYQIIRMHTGNVEDKLVATILCKNDIITTISFNRDLIRDNQYRKYNSISVLHQLSMPYDFSDSGCFTRGSQLRETLKSVISTANPIINVVENNNQLSALVTEDDLRFCFKFIINKNGKDMYELVSISLES